MEEIQEALRKRYPSVHPLLFHRCIERAKSNGELFDMLESLPQGYPIVWDDTAKMWVSTDLLQRQEEK